jgi:hypothetical protein
MFRFTIRDVLWLMVVVALGLGWWVSYRPAAKEVRRLRGVVISQEIDLQLVEHALLNVPDEDFDLIRLRGWAKERRAQHGGNRGKASPDGS